MYIDGSIEIAILIENFFSVLVGKARDRFCLTYDHQDQDHLINKSQKQQGRMLCGSF